MIPFALLAQPSLRRLMGPTSDISGKSFHEIKLKDSNLTEVKVCRSTQALLKFLQWELNVISPRNKHTFWVSCLASFVHTQETETKK